MGAIDRLDLHAGSPGSIFPAAGLCSEGFELVNQSSGKRKPLQNFIAQTFAHRYGASVSHFNDLLLGCRDSANDWMAALGFTGLANKTAFLEAYLDESVEKLISKDLQKRGFHHQVKRGSIAEVGNMAATRAGGARALIVETTRLLHLNGYAWVVITATKELLNSFAKLGYQTFFLADADPQRLSDGGRTWGSYYDSRPQVVYVSVDASFEHISHQI